MYWEKGITCLLLAYGVYGMGQLEYNLWYQVISLVQVEPKHTLVQAKGTLYYVPIVMHNNCCMVTLYQNMCWLIISSLYCVQFIQISILLKILITSSEVS